MTVRRRVKKAPDERRRELIDTARSLFVEKGYDATSVSHIVRKIGTAQGTFYWYFDSKQDILLTIQREMMERIMAVIRGVVDNDTLTAVEKLRRSFQDVVGLIQSDESLAQAIGIRVQPQIHEMALGELGPQMLELFASIIRQGIAEGSFSVGRPETAAAFLVTLGEKIFDETARSRGLWRISGSAEAMPDLGEALWEFALSGLGYADRGSTAPSGRREE